MRHEPLGDAGIMFRELPLPAWQLARALEENLPQGVLEVVPSYSTLALYLDPTIPMGEEGQHRLFEHLEALAARKAVEPIAIDPKAIEIPVCYEKGQDLAEVAGTLGISPADVIERHMIADYQCVAVGFRPGFAYLAGLDPLLATIGRRPSPRGLLEAGSVGLAAGQTGVYPQVGPGGWQIIGHCPRILVDTDSGFFPIRAGDRVRFVAISSEEFDAQRGLRL